MLLNRAGTVHRGSSTETERDLLVETTGIVDYPEGRKAPVRIVNITDPFIVAYTKKLQYVHINV